MLQFERIAATQKSAVVGFFDLSNALFDGMKNLTELNLQAAKATLQESVDSTLTALSIQNPADLVALQTRVFQAVPEKATSYLRHVQDIATTSSTELRQYVEDVTADAKTELGSFATAAAKSAPAGAERAVEMMQSAMTAATNAIETAQQATAKVVAAAKTFPKV